MARVARGTDGDALYTNSTLALDPDTGEMKWYYQHLPGETQDMDEVFERILVDVAGRKSVFEMGKLGILWQLDRAGQCADRESDIPSRQDPATWHRGRSVPKHGRIQKLARDVLQPADSCVL